MCLKKILKNWCLRSHEFFFRSLKLFDYVKSIIMKLRYVSCAARKSSDSFASNGDTVVRGEIDAVQSEIVTKIYTYIRIEFS